VHEDSRIKITITIPREDSMVASMSELTDSSEDDEQSGDDYNEGQRGPVLRVMPVRAAKGKRGSSATTQTKLPFSPKKLRSKPVRRFMTESEDELARFEEDDIIEVIPARRSTRQRKSARTNLTDDYVDEAGDSETDSETYQETSRRPGKSKAVARTQKRIRRGPVSRPAYGIFRSVADLEFDAYDEEDTELLRAHRDICEKCHKAPAHVQLEKPKKKGRKKGKEDEFEIEEDEDDLIQSLGGWVRWYDPLT